MLTFSSLEVRMLDERRDLGRQLEHNGHCLAATHNNFGAFRLLNLLALAAPSSLIM